MWTIALIVGWAMMLTWAWSLRRRVAALESEIRPLGGRVALIERVVAITGTTPGAAPAESRVEPVTAPPASRSGTRLRAQGPPPEDDTTIWTGTGR